MSAKRHHGRQDPGNPCRHSAWTARALNAKTALLTVLQQFSEFPTLQRFLTPASIHPAGPARGCQEWQGGWVVTQGPGPREVPRVAEWLGCDSGPRPPGGCAGSSQAGKAATLPLHPATRENVLGPVTLPCVNGPCGTGSSAHSLTRNHNLAARPLLNVTVPPFPYIVHSCARLRIWVDI